MGRATAAQLARRLIAEGLKARTPAACVSDVSRGSQRIVRTTVGELAGGIDLPDAPTVILIGRTLVHGACDPGEPTARKTSRTVPGFRAM
jgi:siroheme synthase